MSSLWILCRNILHLKSLSKMVPLIGNEELCFLSIWTPFQGFCSFQTTIQSECALEILLSHNKKDLKKILLMHFCKFSLAQLLF